MGNCNSRNRSDHHFRHSKKNKAWHYNVSVPGFRMNPNTVILITSCLIAAALIYTTIKNISFVSVMSFIVLATLIYMLLSSMGGNLMSVSLPFGSYPNPPHLGLDGVSVDNYLAGKSVM